MVREPMHSKGKEEKQEEIISQADLKLVEHYIAGAEAGSPTLAFLASHQNIPLSEEMLIEKAWDDNIQHQINKAKARLERLKDDTSASGMVYKQIYEDRIKAHEGFFSQHTVTLRKGIYQHSMANKGEHAKNVAELARETVASDMMKDESEKP